MYVYCIKNIITGMVYIGQTVFNTDKRFNFHKYQLRNNKHHNTHLQHSWNKHKEINFIFEILEYCNTQDELNFLEIYYIKHYDSTNVKYGYNKCFGGIVPDLTQEARDKLSNSLKEYYSKNPHNHTGKKQKPENVLKRTEGLKRHYKNNMLTKGEKCSPERGHNISMSLKKYYSENPEALKHRVYTEEDKLIQIKNLSITKSEITHPLSKRILAVSPDEIEMCFFSTYAAAFYTKVSTPTCRKRCIDGIPTKTGWRLKYV